MTQAVQQLDQKRPRASEAAERAVLGSVLLNQEMISLVADQLSPDDFFDFFNRRVFRAMLDCFERSVGINPVEIDEVMKRDGNAPADGNIARITELDYGLPMVSSEDAAAILDYCDIVRDKKIKRDLILAADSIKTLALEDEDPAEWILSQAQARVDDLCSRREKSTFSTCGELAPALIDKIQALHRGDRMPEGLQSGFTDLDKITGGFQKSDLIIIAGRPAMGKSSLAGGFVVNASTHDPEMVLPIFSLEMSREQYVQRITASIAGVDLNKMRTGKLTEQEIERLICAKDAVAKLNILIDDSSSVNAIDIRLRLMRVKHERGRLDGVVVDFLQRMRASKPTESRQTEVSRIAQDLKSLAKDLGVPVIAVSSLSRACEDRKRPRPRMSDLRDSGDIESEADVVGLLFRPHYYDPNADATLAELIIDKHRHGATGTINLRFMPEFATFCDYRR